MQENLRILLKEYCETHNNRRNREIRRIINLSYILSVKPFESDAQLLQNAIEQEKDPQIKAALMDLNEFMFG